MASCFSGPSRIRACNQGIMSPHGALFCPLSARICFRASLCKDTENFRFFQGCEQLGFLPSSSILVRRCAPHWLQLGYKTLPGVPVIRNGLRVGGDLHEHPAVAVFAAQHLRTGRMARGSPRWPGTRQRAAGSWEWAKAGGRGVSCSPAFRACSRIGTCPDSARDKGEGGCDVESRCTVHRVAAEVH
jgi:hypothetical protein